MSLFKSALGMWNWIVFGNIQSQVQFTSIHTGMLINADVMTVFVKLVLQLVHHASDHSQQI